MSAPMLAAVAAAKQPNIVFILADDLGYNMIGWKNNITVSPHIDGLFENGLEMLQLYSHKWCAPTRAALMTGRLPYHTGIEHGSLGSYAAPEQYLALHSNFSFLPGTLKAAGYRTHMLGKWNLGFWHEQVTPVGRGFDSYLGYLSPDEQYYTHFKWPPYSGGKGDMYNTSLPHLPYITDLSNGTGPALHNPYNGTYSTFMYTQEATQIIAQEAARQDGVPFFLYLAVQSIHTPLEAPQEYKDMYEGKVPGAANHSDAQITMAMVTALDDLVGNVTQAIKAGGMYDNTLIIFTSDNGGDTHGNNWPLRSGKFTVWEGGLRVVSAISGGFLPSPCHGRRSRVLMHQCDWHPTFAHLAGVPAAKLNQSGPRPIDGVNQWETIASCGVLEPAAAPPRTELLHHFDGAKKGAFRQGDMKLIVGGFSPSCWHGNYPDEPGKTCNPGRPDPRPVDWHCVPCKSEGPTPCTSKPCLFNVSADASERHDLAAAMPEVAARMLARYLELGRDACTPSVESACLQYIGRDDQARWVAQTLSSLFVSPLPDAGSPFGPLPSPSPPPSPPTPTPAIDPSKLSGKWNGGIEMLVNSNNSVSVSNDMKRMCWNAGTGVVSTDGRTISLNATGKGCSPEGIRLAKGTVTKQQVADEFEYQIMWQCTKPPSKVPDCNWPVWSMNATKQGVIRGS